MSSKWNEKSTLVFLNAYQKHPCLWNPNHVKYYDCLAKNEALKNVIKELNIPELNISDCLEQIKVIREKYGQEQLRIIKALQLHKPYKPSFAWFPVISEMLAKVIYDEGKLQKRIRSMKKMSPYALQDYVTIPYDKDENVNFPCIQKETKEHNEAHKANSKKNIKSTKTEYVPTNSDELNGKNKFNTLSDLLQCPTCAWENNSDKSEINSKKKINEYIKPIDPSSEYINFADKPYNTYQRAVDNVHQQGYTAPNSNFLQNSSNNDHYSNILTNHTFSPQNAHTNQQTQTMFVESKLQSNNNHMKEIQLSNERLLPEKEVRRTNIENHKKGIQNTIVSRRKIARTPRYKYTKNISALQNTHDGINKQKYHKENRNESSVREKTKQIAVNTVEQHDQGTQSTVVEKATSTTQTSERVDVNSVKSPKCDTRDVADISLKTAECSKPNFILITIDGHCMLTTHDLKLEQLIDKWKDERIAKRDQKEVEETRVTLEDKKPIEDKDSIRETCSDDTIEILKHNSVVTQTLLQCLEKMIQFQEENSSEMTVCEPCKFAVESRNFTSNSVVESESPSCLPCVEEMEKTDVIGTLVKSFLELMKHALVLNGKKCIKNHKCRKQDAIDAFIFLNKMKECTDKILKIHMIANCLKKQSLKKFCPGRNKCPPKPSFIPSSIKTEVSENDTEPSALTSEEEEDVQLLYASPKSEITDDTISENHVVLEVEEKPSVKDQEMLAYVEKYDVTTDALPQVLHRDIGTQYKREHLRDAAVEVKPTFKEMLNVGTQTCELILFLNAEYGESKLDKERCLCHAHRSCAWTRYIQKYMEIYPLLRPCLSRTTCQKYFIRESCNEELHSDGQIHEKEMNYHACSLSKKNYKCNGQCSNTLSYNLLPLECSENTVSRIPSYTRSRKYVRRRTDLYGMSQCM